MPSRNAPGRSRKSRNAARVLSEDLVVGIDLGATKVVSGLVASDGTIVRHSGYQLHANDGPEGVMEALVRSARALIGIDPGAPLSAVGIAVAAQVDPGRGIVVHAPNLGWRNVPLAERVSEQLRAPVTIVNDARAATMAEWRHGAGTGVDDLFCLSLGTGVGGSAVVGGRILEGGTHALGEVGHITVAAGGRKCHCPNSGCFEAYVGGWAIAERAREACGADPAAGRTLLSLAGNLPSITARTVFEANRAGDPLAVRIVEETERYLADGVVSVVNAFNPSVLVLGGGLVTGHPRFLSVAEGAIRSRCQPPAARALVRPAHFGEDAAVVGAAEFARSRTR